jgi:SAM-dependent methyltransferase
MKNHKEFLAKRETEWYSRKRLKTFIHEYKSYHKKNNVRLKILDIGCGKKAELFKYKIDGDYYYGCDFWDEIDIEIDNYTRVDLNEDNLSRKFENQLFDVIFCGEVIEHLFSPDDLIDEIKILMHPKSILILSTPNLAYWVNRLFLILGISPLFLENSSEIKLGRMLKIFGQFNKTEGHIRLFTLRALLDFFKLKNLKIIRIVPVSIWDIWALNILDKVISSISKSLSPDNVVILSKNE